MSFPNPFGPEHQLLLDRRDRAMQATADALLRLARGEITAAEAKTTTKELRAVNRELLRAMKELKNRA